MGVELAVEERKQDLTLCVCQEHQVVDVETGFENELLSVFVGNRHMKYIDIVS